MGDPQVSQALIQNDGTVVGILALCLGFVFYTSNSAHPFWRSFYRYTWAQAFFSY